METVMSRWQTTIGESVLKPAMMYLSSQAFSKIRQEIRRNDSCLPLSETRAPDLQQSFVRQY
uniref:Uncharacterized protein n=1 Tax=Pristionchus pacificus TaxID=54126 RepID=A0A2A6BGX8_PRIPA|eukprot:PDM65144.1 hypothetical protein PRIPAC_53393 [Pristionchus pacificus]